jgi:LPXTG-site transpeptidase (sortase) family protein
MKPDQYSALALFLAGLCLVFVGLMTEVQRARTATARAEAAAVEGITSPGLAGLTAEIAGAPVPPARPVAISRIRLPTIGVDAPVVVLGVDPQGVMEAPKGPVEVGWYDFSALPGEASNVVLAGHLDFAGYGPAVFWRLRNLRLGDQVELYLEDGTAALYRVIESKSYRAASAPVAEIVGPKPAEVVTLITCGGTFDPKTRQYSERLVVRGVRI